MPCGRSKNKARPENIPPTPPVYPIYYLTGIYVCEIHQIGTVALTGTSGVDIF